MMQKATSHAALAALLILTTLAGECLAKDYSDDGLRVGFYAGKCGKHDVESIVFEVVKKAFLKDTTLVAALLRMQFHDCFVRGCDASILLDGKKSEKASPPNGSVRGFEVIDAVKAALEKACPGLVSCADIIAIATRATVVMAEGTWYNVETGRRDGIVSKDDEVLTSLPGITISVADAIKAYAANGINKEEFVLLQGAHTVGIAHCFLFQDRLYNFSGSGKTDPSMDAFFASSLKKACPRNGNGFNEVFLDQSHPSGGRFIGNGFYKGIAARKGVLSIDHLIALDPSTKSIVAKYAADNALFKVKFGDAMVKLGRVGVLTGQTGQIRKSCRRVNA